MQETSTKRVLIQPAGLRRRERGTLSRLALLGCRNRRFCSLAAQGLPLVGLAGEFGLSLRSAQRLWREAQVLGREPRPRRPGPPPGRCPWAAPACQVQLVCDFKRQWPGKGQHFCHHLLRRQGLRPPAPTTIWRIWRRAGLLGGKRARRQCRRHYDALAAAPGFFQLDTLYLAGDRFAFSAVETQSRWAWAGLAQRRDSAAAAGFLHALARAYPGALRAVQTDNGGEFAGAFKAACGALGLEHHRAWVRCPDQNGKVERFNRTLREESLLGTDDPALPDNALAASLAGFIAWYNDLRPHCALGWRTPLECLQQSSPEVPTAQTT